LRRGTSSPPARAHPPQAPLVANQRPSRTTPISRYDYANDNLGRRWWIERSGTAHTPATIEFPQYKSRNELIESDKVFSSTMQPVPGWTYDYAYDPIGNRLWSEDGNGVSTVHATNARNQYTAIERDLPDPPPPGVLEYVEPQYEADGNLTNEGKFSYAWDAENRLVGVAPATTQPAVGDVRLAFTYDYLHRRVWKQVFTWNGTAWPATPSSDIRFVYDGWNVLMELDGLNIGGTGVPPVNLAYFYDANGNVGQLRNVSTGASPVEYEYDPYGNVLIANGTFAGTNPFRFSGGGWRWAGSEWPVR
jgi:hypothetical protein